MKLPDSSNLTISVPWPVRLFGEAMESFGLPTASAALNLRTAIRISKRDDDLCSLHGHRIDSPVTFNRDLKELPANHTHTLALAVKALQPDNVFLDSGYDFEIFTLVPEIEDVLNSPAMLVAWITTLLTLSEQVKDKSGSEIAEIAVAALDHETSIARAVADIHTCVLGGTIFIRDPRNPVIEQIDRGLPGLVYAYPKHPAKTPFRITAMHERTRSAIDAVGAALPAFSLTSTPLDEILPKLDAPGLKEHAGLLYAHMSNRDDSITARDLLEREFGLDDDYVGELMDRSHEMFRDYLGYASPKVESLITSAIQAGALGTKSNVQSNSTLTFAGVHQDEVIAAMRSAKCVALPVEISEGVSIAD